MLIILTDDIRRKAAQRAKEMPVLHGSHRGKEANVVGCLGEVVVEQLLNENGIEFSNQFSTSHDLMLPDGRTVEIKTKDRTVRPQPHYDCTRPAYNVDHQTANFFVFVSLYRPSRDKKGHVNDYTEAHVVGAIGRVKFDRLAKFWRKGETDPSNGTRFWTDCYNVYISQLRPIENAMEYWLSVQSS
jgi:hypothetical protein